MDIYNFVSTVTMIFLLFQLYLLRPSFTRAVLTNIDTDRAALLAFKSQLYLEPYHVLSMNWSDSTPICSWVGVTCGSRHQRVVMLQISEMGITGNLVPQIGNLSFLVSLNLSRNNIQGIIPKELAQLRRLRVLDLRQNNISGELPSWFGSFSRLRILSLTNNTFTGVIPPSLSNLSNLESLLLPFNRLQGGIPQELGYLQRLRILGLQGNQLTGSVPVTLFSIRTLRIIGLNFNRLQGPIPEEVGNLTLLRELYLNDNILTGEVPTNLLNISTLRLLELANNQLSGHLPSNFGRSLPNMEVLYLFGNNFTSESPDLSFITSLTHCRYLISTALSDNPLNGRLPSTVGNLSASLQYFSASNCGLHGSIPDEIGNLSNLMTLALHDNHFTGPLPKTLGHLQSLQGLDLNRNDLIGTIPSTMCELLYLQRMLLTGNRITNPIPHCIRNLTSLRILRLGYNRLNSTIPRSLWHLRDLRRLDLSSNLFYGSLLPEIGNLRAVTLIDLSGNQLSGTIPSTIGDLNTLSIFYLDHNKLQGSIPESVSQMVSLEYLDLSHNNLSGSIPLSLEKLDHLIGLNVTFNELSGEIPSNGPFENFTSQSFLSNKELCGDTKYQVPPCRIRESNRRTNRRAIIISVPISIIVVGLILAYIFTKHQRTKGVSVRSYQWSVPTPLRFSYNELLEATELYAASQLLGTGSFGSVYRGTLKDGTDVAVKVFNLQFEGAYKSFEVECEVLRKLRHKNLSKVIGSCSNQEFKALVLEYMPHGSLEKWLYSHNYFLDILQRIGIMKDVASALEYLHYGYSSPIIHCDLKPSNILLDENMGAHLCDFGIAKLLADGESCIQTLTLGTLGYIAPEFGLEGLVSARCDVYSYGIILMEVFTRMKPNDERLAENLSLRSWIKDFVPDGIIQIIDFNLVRPDEEFFIEKLNCLSVIFELALSCTMESPSETINITDVRVALEKIKIQLLSYY